MMKKICLNLTPYLPVVVQELLEKMYIYFKLRKNGKMWKLFIHDHTASSVTFKDEVLPAKQLYLSAASTFLLYRSSQ